MPRSVNCPQCGAVLKIDSGVESVECSCGRKFKIRRSKRGERREPMPSEKLPKTGELQDLEPLGSVPSNSPGLGDLSQFPELNPSQNAAFQGDSAGTQIMHPLTPQPKKKKVEEEKPRFSPTMIYAIYGGASVLVLVGLFFLFLPGKQPVSKEGDGTWEGSTYVLNKDLTGIEAANFIEFSAIHGEIEIENKDLLEIKEEPTPDSPSDLVIEGTHSLDNLAGVTDSTHLVMNFIPGNGVKTFGTVYWVRADSQTTEVLDWQAITSHAKSNKHQLQVGLWLNSNPAIVSPSGNRLALHHYSDKTKIQFFDWHQDENKRKSYSSNTPVLKNNDGKKILDFFWLDDELFVTGDKNKVAIWRIPAANSRSSPSLASVEMPENTIKHSGRFFLLKKQKKVALIQAEAIEILDLEDPDQRTRIPTSHQTVNDLVVSDDGSLISYYGRGFVVVDLDSGKQVKLGFEIGDEETKKAFLESISNLAFHDDELVIEARPTLVVDWKKGRILNSADSVHVRFGKVWRSHGSPSQRIYSKTLRDEELAESTKSLMPEQRKFRVEINCFDNQLAPKIGVAAQRLIHKFGGQLGEGGYTIKFDVQVGEEGKFTGVGAKYKTEGNPPKVPSIDFAVEVKDASGEVCRTDKFSLAGIKSVRVRPGEVTWLTLKPEEKEEIIEKLKERVVKMESPGSPGFRPRKLEQWLDSGE